MGIDLPNMIRIQKDFYERQQLHYKSAPIFIDIKEANRKNEFDQNTIFCPSSRFQKCQYKPKTNI